MLIFFIGSHTVVVEVLVETQTTPIEPKPDIMPAQAHTIAVAPTPFKEEATMQVGRGLIVAYPQDGHNVNVEALVEPYSTPALVLPQSHGIDEAPGPSNLEAVSYEDSSCAANCATVFEPKPDIMPAQAHGIALAPTPFKDENEADHGSSNLPISRMEQTVSDCDYNTSTEGSSIGNIDSSGTMECKSTKY